MKYHVQLELLRLTSSSQSFANGTSIFEPYIDVRLGDIGFMDENDSLFRKLHSVAEPPVHIDGCPFVNSALRYQRLDAILVSFAFFFLILLGLSDISLGFL
jgi:hypothetical protein